MKKWNREEIIILVKEIFKTTQLMKSDFWNINTYKIYKLPPIRTIKRLFSNLDNLAKECNITFKPRNRAEFLKNNPQVLEKIIKNSIMFKKEKLENKYGNEKASLIKQKLSQRMTKITWEEAKYYYLLIYKIIGPVTKMEFLNKYFLKDKDFVKIKYGSLDNLAKSWGITFKPAPGHGPHDITKVPNYKSKESIVEKAKQIYKIHGTLQKRKLYEYLGCSFTCIKKKFGSIENLVFTADIKIKPREGWGIGINENEILDFIEKQNNIKIQRNIKIDKYYVDGLDKQHNIVYEVDEIHHNYYKNKQKDNERDIFLQKNYGLQIIRLPEKQIINQMRNKTIENTRFI